MVLRKNAADKLDGEKDKQRAYWMNFKQDANSLPKLSNENVFLWTCMQNNRCNIAKTCNLGMKPGKIRRGTS